jgi:hypothetical protein
VILRLATGSLIERSWYFNQAYTWLQPWEFNSSVAGFVGLTSPLCCGYSPLHLLSSDNSCHPAAFPSFLSNELLVPHCAGRTKPFNYILKVLYTGMQWKELPIDKTPDGRPEIHYTGVFKLFARWCADSSLEQAFIASVEHLDGHQKLDLSLLHGDGSNTVAKKEKYHLGFKLIAFTLINLREFCTG